jgi:hypothetical protein
MSTSAALIVVILLHAGCATAGDAASPPPAPMTDPTPSHSTSPIPSVEATPAPNVQASVLSEEGLFVGSWVSVPGTPPINVVHEWVIHVETVAGEPVEGATVRLNGDMPAHGHGMPTQPEVTADLGDGDYRVEGMAFQMGGYWIIDVTVTVGSQTDLIRFGLEL